MIIKKLMILNALIKNVIYLELKVQFYHAREDSKLSIGQNCGTYGGRYLETECRWIEIDA